MKAVAKTVSASVDPALGPGTRESPAILKVTLSDGQTFEQRVDYQTGSIKNPMTQAQIENKFRDCAAQSVKTGRGDQDPRRPQWAARRGRRSTTSGR